jgi:hypothetical protein
MSTTIASAREGIRILLKEVEVSGGMIDTERLTYVLVRQAQLAGAEVKQPDTWVTGAFTLSDSGSPDFTIAGSTYDYEAITHLRRASDGFQLRRQTRDVIEWLRATSSPATGPPTDYYFHEPTSRTLKVRLHPRPIAADTIDALVQRFAIGTFELTDTIEGSEWVLRAIELRTAAEILGSLPPDDLVKLKLAPAAGVGWIEQARVFIQKEQERKNRLRAVSHIPAQVS